MESLNISKYGKFQWEYEDPEQFPSFWFEKVDGNELRFWAGRNLPTCGIICFAYAIFIWLGPLIMKNRNPFKLEKSLAVWNFLLSLFSLTVVVRMVPPLFHQVKQENGYYRSVCLLEPMNYATTFWSFLFVCSKIAELGDTVFIVLRKKTLIFLHIFHHFNMVWSSFYLFVEGEPAMKYVVITNSLVHTIMYSYYGLMTLRIKLPQKLPMMITILQISQFLIGGLGTFQQLIYYGLVQDKPCLRTWKSLITSIIFGFSYFLLFVHLFYKSYIVKEKRKTA